MKQVFNAVIDAVGTFILMIMVAIIMVFVYTILLPIGTIVKSCMEGELLSESWITLNRYFISKVNEINED